MMNLFIEVMHGRWMGTQGQSVGPTPDIETLVNKFLTDCFKTTPEVVIDMRAIQVQQIVFHYHTVELLGLN